MFPYFTLFGRQIYLYGLCAFLGAALGWILMHVRLKRNPVMKDTDCEMAFIFALIGVFVGAKVLSIITVLPDIIKDIGMLSTDPKVFLSRYLYSGFVFYGGLIGGILGVWIYSRRSRIPFRNFITVMLPSVPLIHAVGRLGCFFSGCCYGIPSEKFGIIFKNSEIAPNDIPLLPTQLIETAGNLIITLVLVLYMRRRDRHPYRALALYLTMYGVMRFVLEFFRYDAYRGFVGAFSTSQWICFGVWIFAGILVALARREEKKTEG